MRPESRTVEEKLAWFGRRAHGVVTREEVLRAGISASGIKRRVQKGLLITQSPGVYRVGHAAPSTDASFIAAVKACGEGAFLSGLPAGYLFGLIKGQPPPPEVTTPTERKVRGIKTRRCRRLDKRDVTKVRGIPVTTVPRTLVALAGTLTADDLARACHEAGVRYRTTPRQVEAVLKRRPNAPGQKKLRAVMRGDTAVTLSELERLFVKAVREAGLPPPVTNKPAGGRRVDCRWPGRLTVELHSYRFHNSRYAWEQDRRREREARAREEELLRYTWYDVTDGRAEMLRELSPLLA